MNYFITLTNGEKVDVRDFVGYTVESTPYKTECILFLKGARAFAVTLADIECIERFRKELREIEIENGRN